MSRRCRGLFVVITLSLLVLISDPTAGQALLGADLPRKSPSNRARSSSARANNDRAATETTGARLANSTRSDLLPTEQAIIDRLLEPSVKPAQLPSAQSVAGSSTPSPLPAAPAETHPEAAGAPKHGLINPVAWQAALDRAGFSPGVIDGAFGPKFTRALKAFQESRGLPQTGRPDQATAESLNLDQHPSLMRYRITEGDVAEVRPPPKRWQDKAKSDFLGYESFHALVAERGHCSKWLVSRLNHSADLTKLRAGSAVILPGVEKPEPAGKANTIEIDFTNKTIRAADASGKTLAFFHCSIAREHGQRPSGPCTVAEVVDKPRYLFDPKKWPEVKDVKEKLLIPPGPRNPVGLCWIGLSIDGFGIHGTPEPELIGKTGSHGCFRLTNWDARRLADMASVGTDVKLVDSAPRIARRSTAAKHGLATHRR